MVLKQWRVPRTFTLFRFFTNSCASAAALAMCCFCVLYTTLPAQLVSLPSAGHNEKGVSILLPTAAEHILRNVRLSMRTLCSCEDTLKMQEPHRRTDEEGNDFRAVDDPSSFRGSESAAGGAREAATIVRRRRAEDRGRQCRRYSGIC